MSIETNSLLGLFDIFRTSQGIDSFLYHISIKLALGHLHSHKPKRPSNECLGLCPRNIISKFHGITRRIEHRMGGDTSIAPFRLAQLVQQQGTVLL